MEESVQRVAKTELGVRVILEKFLGYFENTKDGYRHSISLVFKCKILGKKDPKPLEQASEIKFFDKLPKKIVPKHKQFIIEHLKNFSPS